MRWIESSDGWSFHEKCVCASTMPGINVAPAPSITVAPEADDAGNERTLPDVRVTRADAIALHQHFAGIRLIAAAVEDAHVGE